MDRRIQMSHVIHCKKNLDVRQFPTLFLKEIIRLHSIPHDIGTDRSSQFTSDIWKDITEELGIKRRLSTALYLQTDGQTKLTNGILE